MKASGTAQDSVAVVASENSPPAGLISGAGSVWTMETLSNLTVLPLLTFFKEKSGANIPIEGPTGLTNVLIIKGVETADESAGINVALGSGVSVIVGVHVGGRVC